MILCPVQNGATFLGGTWLQKRPRVTQWFGENPQIYKQFGHKGHNGIDFGIPEGTPLFAPIEGVVKIVTDEGSKGYGKYIEIWKDNLKVVLAHLSDFKVVRGQTISLGDVVAKSGNTGFSTGPHLHMTLKFMENGQVLNRDNGYAGAINPAQYTITWKGTLKEYTHS